MGAPVWVDVLRFSCSLLPHSVWARPTAGTSKSNPEHFLCNASCDHSLMFCCCQHCRTRICKTGSMISMITCISDHQFTLWLRRVIITRLLSSRTWSVREGAVMPTPSEHNWPLPPETLTCKWQMVHATWASSITPIPCHLQHEDSRATLSLVGQLLPVAGS